MFTSGWNRISVLSQKKSVDNTDITDCNLLILQLSTLISMGNKKGVTPRVVTLRNSPITRGNASSSVSTGSPTPLTSSRCPTCHKCKQPVVTDSVFCLCKKVYHSECTARLKKLPSRAFNRCCGGSLATPSLAKTNCIMDKEERKRFMTDIRGEVSRGVSEEMKSITGMVNYVKNDIQGIPATVMNEVTAAMKLLMDDFRADFKMEMNLEITSIKQSIADLRSTVNVLGSRVENIEIKSNERIDFVLSKVTELQQQIDDPTRNNSCGATSGSLLSVCLNEFEERMARKKNVIILWISEPECGDAKLRKGKDQAELLKVFNVLSDGEPMDNFSCRRLGKYSKNLIRPRPLQAFLSSSTKASYLIQSCRQKKISPDAPDQLIGILVLPDQTERQRQQYNMLKVECAARIIKEKNPNLN